jgi:hypothetical protein
LSGGLAGISPSQVHETFAPFLQEICFPEEIVCDRKKHFAN